MKRINTIITLIIILMGLSGCSFHSPLTGFQQWQPHTVGITSDGSLPNTVVTQVKSWLANASLTVEPLSKHPYWLISLGNYTLNHSSINYTISDQPVSLTYYILMTARLSRLKQGPPLTQNTFESSQVLIEIPSQLLTQVHSPTLIDNLQHEVIVKMIYWLSELKLTPVRTHHAG